MYNFISTYSGKYLTFLEPLPEQITFDDIPNNLSNLCRFGGNVNKFYSVAEHSVLVSRVVFDITKDKSIALSALMHDATEAYLCDIPRPIKPHLTGYIEIEQALQEVIFKKYNIKPLDPLIHNIDTRIVADEATALFNDIPCWVKDYDKVNVDIQGYCPQEAKNLFIEEYKYLTS